jgi:hypothetical protein
MPRLGFTILVTLVVLVTLASGAALIALAMVPEFGASPHAPALVSMFSDTWKNGVAALIGLLVGLGSR